MWAEIDRKEGVWTVPATRMKAKREHRVPLCRRATQVLDEAWALGGGSPIVFTRGHGQQLAEKQLRHLLSQIGIEAALLPVVVPGLGGRGDRSSERGHRGG